MYKITVLTSFVLFLVVSANAQESSSDNIINRFEFVVGPSFSSNTGYLSDYESKGGYAIGIGYYQKIYKSFSINVRSLFEQKGSVANYPKYISDGNSDYAANEKYTTKFNYLTIYLLPTLQFGKNKNIFVNAGGYYSFLNKLAVNRTITNTDTGDVVDEYTYTNKNYFDPDFDAGVSFQMGYSFKVSNKVQLMIQAFANRGLVDLSNPSLGSQRNNTYGVNLSVRMR